MGNGDQNFKNENKSDHDHNPQFEKIGYEQKLNNECQCTHNDWNKKKEHKIEISYLDCNISQDFILLQDHETERRITDSYILSEET